MPKHTHYDNELAAFTDQLLAGKEPAMLTDESELADVVRQLHRTISPEKPVSQNFKKRLTQRLTMEWDLQHQNRSHWWTTPRVQQIATLLAASVVLVIAATLLLSVSGGDNSSSLEGAATAPLAGIAVIALIAVGLLSLIVFFRRDR